MRIGMTSPRTTVPYQIDDSSPITTSPITEHVSARNTPRPSSGCFPANVRIVAAMSRRYASAARRASVLGLLRSGEDFVDGSIEVVRTGRDRRHEPHDAAAVDDHEVHALGIV